MEFNPYSPELHLDPYPLYRRLRDEFPIHHNPDLHFWSLSRYDDVFNALQDPATYISSKGVAVGLPEMPMGGSEQIPLLIMMDGRRHTKMRALVGRAFTPRRIAELETKVREIATELIDTLLTKPEVDLVRDFSAPLPTIVIAELLGVPREDQEMFKRNSTAVSQFDPANAGSALPGSRDMGPAMELSAYFAEAFEARRHEPRDDFLSALLSAEIDGEKLTHAELIGFAFLLLVAGNETTTNLISNAIALLDQHRGQREKLCANPDAIATAIEEFLRFDSPVQGLARTLTRDVEFYGQRVPAGDKVLLLFGSANRDERKIADPDRFDISRDPNPHLSFGFNAHFCLGASLARLEARVAFEELLSRVPDYRLLDPQVERLCSGPIRGAVKLPAAIREA